MPAKFDTVALKNRMQEIAQRELGAGLDVGHGIIKFICPFHADTNPSLTAYQDHYHCYTCGAHGDVIEMIMRLRGLNFVDACKYLDAESTTPETIQTFQAERESKKQAEIATREKMRLEYAKAAEYEKYRNMNPAQIAQWDKWGINKELRDFWKVGYTSEKKYRVNDNELTSPAYVMPIHTPLNGKPPMVITSQFRLTNPAPGAGKFRFEYRPSPGLGTAAFVAQHNWRMGETPGQYKTCLIVEGPRKAATTWARALSADDIQVIGIPSKCDSGGMVEALKTYQWVYVWLDPDVINRPKNAAANWEPSDIRLCRMIGTNKTSFIRYPMKIDDALLDGTLGTKTLLRILSMSERVEV